MPVSKHPPAHAWSESSKCCSKCHPTEVVFFLEVVLLSDTSFSLTPFFFPLHFVAIGLVFGRQQILPLAQMESLEFHAKIELSRKLPTRIFKLLLRM